MLRALILSTLLALLLITNTGCTYEGVIAEAATRPTYTQGGPPAQPLRYTLTGPYNSNNLSLFLIHRDDAITTPIYLTLAEAMHDRRVAVNETGNVGQLTIKNRSDHDVFIQSGEIVKGGKQDRTIAEDFILPRDSGRLAIDSFCVESGRWRRRGSESAVKFSSSSQSLPLKEMKLAARLRGSQSEVWHQIAELQQNLDRLLSQSPASEESPTSLEQWLADAVREAIVVEYIEPLKPVPLNNDTAIGYVALINGQINSAEVYATSTLFRQAWPKLLNSLAVESIANLQEPDSESPATQSDLHAFIKHAEGGLPASRQVNARTKVAKYESLSAVLFETCDLATSNWVHRTYYMK
jgi:hypothetical protein